MERDGWGTTQRSWDVEQSGRLWIIEGCSSGHRWLSDDLDVGRVGVLEVEGEMKKVPVLEETGCMALELGRSR